MLVWQKKEKKKKEREREPEINIVPLLKKKKEVAATIAINEESGEKFVLSPWEKNLSSRR